MNILVNIIATAILILVPAWTVFGETDQGSTAEYVTGIIVTVTLVVIFFSVLGLIWL